MLGFCGNSVVRTPNLDRLAAEAVVFDENYVQNPICMPSRASIFTGRYPAVCGTRVNGIPLRESEHTLPELLAASGYRTCAIGKLHFRHQANSLDFNDGYHAEYEGTCPYYGFQEYHLSDDNRIGPYARWVQQNHPTYYDAVMNWPPLEQRLGNTWDCWKAEYPAEIHQTNWITDKTIEFLNRQDVDHPFFGFCSFADPHHPFNPPEPYASMYDDVELPPLKVGENEPDGFPNAWLNFRNRPGFIGDYDASDWDSVRRLAYGMVTMIDDAIGRLVEALTKNGQLDNTIIAFTSDHGEMLGEHCLNYKGTFHFDEVIRTPLLFHAPESFVAGKRSGLSQSLDIMPTLLEVAGCMLPKYLQGQSMLPRLEKCDCSGKDCVLTQNYYRSGSGQNETLEDVNTITTPEWKYTLRSDGDTGQLYNRKLDPEELRNLWRDPEYGAIRSRLAEQMAVALSAANEPDWRREAAW